MRITEIERLAIRIEQLEQENASLRRALDQQGDAPGQHERLSELLTKCVRHHADPIIIIGDDGRIASVNDSFEQLFGWRTDELEGKGLVDVPDLTPGERHSFDTTIREILQAGLPVTALEATGIARDGSTRSLLLTLFPVIGSESEGRCWVIIIRDDTERRRMEELSHKADKLYAMGQLAAGVAHELRNPLTAIKGFIQLIKARPDQVKRNYLEAIHLEMERIEVIMKELLILAKPQAQRLSPVKVESLVNHTVASLSPDASSSGISFECRFKPGLPVVCCEPVQLKQVFLNIVQNAVEAMPEGGRIRIEGRSTEAGEVEVIVSDQGPGITPDRMARLGEPFYTTKEKGAGLGLTVSHKIMAEHGGRLTFKSGSEGTTVTISIPAEGC